MSKRWFNFKFHMRPSESVILLMNVLNCEEVENDADNTVEDLLFQLDAHDGYIKKSILESCLYCCNIQSDAGKFWHPVGWDFKKFVIQLLPADTEFDFYYNIIKEKEGRSGPYTKIRR